MIKCSAIVSTYNSERFIKGCLKDLIDQTLYRKKQLEIIVINSGSLQNEDKIILEFKKRHPDIQYLKTNRESLYKAWNRGIKVAKGKYLTNANTDDRHRKDSLEIMVEYMECHSKIDLVYAWQWISNIPNEPFKENISLNPQRWKKMVRIKMINFLKDPFNNIVQDNKTGYYFKWPLYSHKRRDENDRIGSQPVWRKAVHNKVGYFDSNLKILGDSDFWLKMGKKGCNFARIPEILGVFYVGGANLAVKQHHYLLKELFVIYDRYLKNKPKHMIKFFAILYDLFKQEAKNNIYYKRMKLLFKKISPNIKQAIKMAECHLQKNNDKLAKKALKCAENKLNFGRTPTLLIYRIASCFMLIKDYEKAIKYFNYCSHKTIFRYKSLFKIGEIALEEGQSERAKNYFIKCLKICPEHIKAREYLNSIHQI
jgi:glycosyltransferase involved in cell wall biosynthesis